MAFKINTEIYIGGINRTASVVMPIKFGDFLDERLDECNISLRQTRKDTFSPLTPVEIRVKNTEYFGEWENNPRLTGKVEESVFHYVVANDSATEFRPGSGIYSHELYLIELTKAAECIVVDPLTYTNDIGRNYSDGAMTTQKEEVNYSQYF